MVYVTHSTFTRQQWPGSVELRKGLDVNIASAMASEPSDRTKILNSIRLPRAGTVFLEQEARDTHESNLIDLGSSFPSDFLSPRAESTHSHPFSMLCLQGSALQHWLFPLKS